MNNNCNIFYSEKCDGPMSGIKSFYREGITRQEMIEDLKFRRKLLGQKYGFDGTKLIVPYQNLSLHKEGYCEDVTEMVSDILNDNPNFDLWDLDIPCDIMLIRSSLKGVVLSYPAADCPIVIVGTKDTVALAHCSSVCVDRELPMQIVDAVSKVGCANEKDMFAYVGPCAGEAYIYREYPNWAKNENWKYFIEDSSEGYKIDLKGAVKSQLTRMGLSNIYVSPIDTITDDRFYSNHAYMQGQSEKNGRFLTGVYFPQEKIKIKTR